MYIFLPEIFFGKFGSLTQGTRTEDPPGPELSWGSGPAKVGRGGAIFKFSGPGGDGATLKYQKNIGSNESYLEEKIKSNIGLRKYKLIDKNSGAVVGPSGDTSKMDRAGPCEKSVGRNGTNFLVQNMGPSSRTPH